MNLWNTGILENEKALRFFKDEGKEKSLHKIYKAVRYDAPGQRLYRLLQIASGRIRYPLPNAHQFVFTRLCRKRTETRFEMEIENHNKRMQPLSTVLTQQEQ